jgi:hypothetical protein
MHDQNTERVMTAVEVEDYRATNWFQAICTTYTGSDGQAVTDWDTYKGKLKTGAAAFDSAFDERFVETFIEKVDAAGISDPIGTIAELSRNRPEELSQEYSALRKKQSAPEGTTTADTPAPDVESLSWVTEGQRSRLAGAVGQRWPDVVRTKLSSVWPEWRQAVPPTLVGVLDQWMATIIAEVPAPVSTAQAPPVAGVESLSWVTEGQRSRLTGAVGQRWPDVIRAKLTEVYPPWRQAGAEALVGFLDQWMATIIAEATPTATPAGPARAGGTSSIPAELLKQYPEEDQAVLTSDAGQTAFQHMRSQETALIEQNPEFVKIDPLRRQELMMQVVAERLGV